MFLRWLLFGLIFVVLTGCKSKVIFFDREQTLLVPQSQMVSLGEEAYSQEEKSVFIISQNYQADQVKNVMSRLIPVVEHDLKKLDRNELLGSLSWKYMVISDNKTINAFCLPGGKIVVYTGLLKIISSNDELAVVLSHEIAHALAEHGNERMSEQLLIQLGGVIVDKVTEKNTEQTREIFQTVYGVGTTVGIALPNSRLHETEADKLGLIILIQAGYDPNAAITFWEKMKKYSGQSVPEFLSTHPSHERRSDELKTFTPKAQEYKNF